MQQRGNNSIWRNLFELPNISSENKFKDLKHLHILLKRYNCKKQQILFLKEIEHKLSHRNLYIRFFRCKVNNVEGIKFVSFEKALTKAVPKPIENFLKEIIK